MNAPTASDFYSAIRANNPAVVPATAYQLYMRDAFGCHIFRDGPCWGISANPERVDYTPGGIGHIPYADEDAADEWATAFEAANPFVGPVAKDHGVKAFRTRGANIHRSACFNDYYA